MQKVDLLVPGKISLGGPFSGYHGPSLVADWIEKATAHPEGLEGFRQQWEWHPRVAPIGRLNVPYLTRSFVEAGCNDPAALRKFDDTVRHLAYTYVECPALYPKWQQWLDQRAVRNTSWCKVNPLVFRGTSNGDFWYVAFACLNPPSWRYAAYVRQYAWSLAASVAAAEQQLEVAPAA